MKIIPMEIKKIKEREGNPNKMNKNQMEALKKSIQKFGELQPAIIDQDNILIDGHQRKQAYEELGKLMMPVIKVNLEDKTDKKLLSQIMNKVRGTHDETLDVAEIKEILKEQDLEELSGYLGQSEQSFLNMINKIEQEEKDGVEQLYKQQVTCPKCGHEFQKKEGIKEK